MAHEDGVEHCQGVHSLVKGVLEHSGPARQALLQHKEVLPQGLLQQAGPALILVEAGAAVGAVGGVGAVAVGVGIPQAEDVFFHGPSSFLSALTRFLMVYVNSFFRFVKTDVLK